MTPPVNAKYVQRLKDIARDLSSEELSATRSIAVAKIFGVIHLLESDYKKFSECDLYNDTCHRTME